MEEAPEVMLDDKVVIDYFGLNRLLGGFRPTKADLEAAVSLDNETKAAIQQAAIVNENRYLKGHYHVDYPATTGMGLNGMMAKISEKQSTSSTAPDTTSTTVKGGGTIEDSSIVKRKAKWYNRLIFNKKPSTFDFNKPINREIGRLTKHKEQAFGTTMPDGQMDMALYSYLLLHKMVAYPNRQCKLEHLSKVAQKYLNEQAKPLTSHPPAYIHRYRMTIQRATDEVDGEFLFKKDTTEYDRRAGWFKKLKQSFSRQSLN